MATVENCIDCGAVRGNSHGMVDCVAEFKRLIVELRVELKCERAVIKQMRRLAYDARSKAGAAIYSIEQLAMSDADRIAEKESSDA